MFTNPTVQSTISQFNVTSFVDLQGFGMYSSSGTVFYYVMDSGNTGSSSTSNGKVHILIDNWLLISSVGFSYPQFMISIENSLYISGYYRVWKVDQDLNILRTYNPGGSPSIVIRGISYNPSNGSIYVGNYYTIKVLNLDLTSNRNINTSPHYPYSVTISSNNLCGNNKRNYTCL